MYLMRNKVGPSMVSSSYSNGLKKIRTNKSKAALKVSGSLIRSSPHLNMLVAAADTNLDHQ